MQDKQDYSELQGILSLQGCTQITGNPAHGFLLQGRVFAINCQLSWAMV